MAKFRNVGTKEKKSILFLDGFLLKKQVLQYVSEILKVLIYVA